MSEYRPVADIETYKERFGNLRHGGLISKEDMENPNSFFNVSRDPANRNMWIGVRQVLLPAGVVITDAKWVDREMDVVLKAIERAESMTGEDVYYLYGPLNNPSARSRMKIREDNHE